MYLLKQRNQGNEMNLPKSVLKMQKVRAANKEDVKSKAEQFKTLSELKNISHVIAKTEINLYGYYAATIDGKKTFVTA